MSGQPKLQHITAQSFPSKPGNGATETDLTGRDFVLVMLHRKDKGFKAITSTMDILHSENKIKPRGRRKAKWLNRNTMEFLLNLKGEN